MVSEPKDDQPESEGQERYRRAERYLKKRKVLARCPEHGYVLRYDRDIHTLARTYGLVLKDDLGGYELAHEAVYNVLQGYLDQYCKVRALNVIGIER